MNKLHIVTVLGNAQPNFDFTAFFCLELGLGTGRTDGRTNRQYTYCGLFRRRHNKTCTTFTRSSKHRADLMELRPPQLKCRPRVSPQQTLSITRFPHFRYLYSFRRYSRLNWEIVGNRTKFSMCLVPIFFCGETGP